MTLEEKLVSLRKEKGLSQLKLAEMMHVSRQAVSRWEVGTAVPSTDNLKYLGRLYDVPLEYLLHDDFPETKACSANAALAQDSGTAKKLPKRKLLAILVFFVLAASIVSCIYIIDQKRNEVVPIETLENDENWGNSETGEFTLDW